MRVLIITYYWPPSGGSGVQRWLKFVKYLHQFGVEPVIYTVANPNYVIEDETLEAEVNQDITVLRYPIKEPNQLLALFSKNDKKKSAGFLDAKPSFLSKISHYIRANYFIPDARKFWVQPSVKFLLNYISKNNIDCVITTGPPHSLHLIGQQLKQKIKLKWVADFRDPWTTIDYFHQLPLTKKSLEKHHKLEASVLTEADMVLVIGNTMRKEYLKFNKNIEVVTNGFDNFDTNSKPPLDAYFSFVHIGMMNADRNPHILWKVLSQLIKENNEFAADFKLKLIGNVASEVLESIKSHGLESHVEIIAYVSHKKVATFQRSAQVLFLAVNKVPSAKGVVTGKIFEYLQAKRPILALGPIDGDLANIIDTTKSGRVIDFDDSKELKHHIINLYSTYKSGTLKIESKGIAQYHRKQLTEKLATILFNLDS